MLERVLEPEVMDSAAEAHDYDSMDHSHVNQLFVSDLLQLQNEFRRILDVGTGTAQIPLELCCRQLQVHVVAIDMAAHMLQVGERNVQNAGLADRIQLRRCDAKRMPFADATFDAVMSNSIVHHIPEPFAVFSEMARVVKPGGLLFVRDLLRPVDELTLQSLVKQYAGDANAHQQQMFADSLHAALTLQEAQAMVKRLGFARTDDCTANKRSALDLGGLRMLNAFEQFGRFTYFALTALPAALLAWRRPLELHRQLHHILLGALPLGGVAGLALGFVVWMHLHAVVEPWVREEVPKYVALGVVLEFAPLGAGLIVAGRSGASLGAELGSMRLSEQIDALEVLGLSPIKQLVAPRVLAAMIALPLLTVIMAYVAIFSSYLAEYLGGTMSWTLYWNAVQRGLDHIQTKIVLSTLKTIVFGYLVAVTGCYFGMEATGGTEGVGRAATRGVVVSIFLVLIANVFLVKLIEMVS